MTGEEASRLLRNNMRVLREEFGLSQSALARRIGKEASYICDLERGRRKKRGPELATLAELATGLGVPLSILLSESLRDANEVSTALKRSK